MNKPYWSGAGSRSGSSFVDDADDSPTRRNSAYGSPEQSTGFYSGGGYRTTAEYRSFEAEPFDDDYDDYDYDDRPDNRWRWIAGLAVAVLLAAVIATTVVMRSDNTSSTAQNQAAPPATSTAPRTVIATVPPSTAPPQAQLSPETVVTITTTPSAAAPLEEIPAAPPEAAPPEAAPPPPDPRTVTYSVTGTRPLFDLVSIIYTDEQGLPRTDVNVALPWSKTVVLNPGVDFESVTATSVTGQLNCAITDATGATLVTQANNSMIATCTS